MEWKCKYSECDTPKLELLLKLNFGYSKHLKELVKTKLASYSQRVQKQDRIYAAIFFKLETQSVCFSDAANCVVKVKSTVQKTVCPNP